jgi:hypothetical protein
MRRWWLAIAVILGVVGATSADYLILVANVGPMRAPEKANGPGGPGGPGGPRPSGPPQGGGGVPGKPGNFGNPMPGRGNPTDTPLPADTKEIEENILVAILPLDLTINSTALAKKAAFTVPYQGRHPHVVAVEYVTEHPQDITIGVTLHRQFDKAHPLGLHLDTPHHKFEAKRSHLASTGKPTVDQVLDLAQFALKHGLLKDVAVAMEDLEKIDKNDPTLKAYQQLEEEFKKGPLPEDPLASQRSALTRERKSISSLHFTLWYNPSATEPQSRLNRLEDTMHTYYLYWAFKKTLLPLPTHRQTVFLDAEESEFKKMHGMLTFRRDPKLFPGDPHEHTFVTSSPLVYGGYYSRREDVSVLSFKRLDPKYDLVNSQGTKVWGNMGGQADKVLAARFDMAPDKLVTQTEAQSYALMARIMEDDAERASISHNVSCQLLVHSGLLPRGVVVPEWLEFGLASYFETPLNAPWPSPTDTNSLYQPILKELMSSAHKASSSGYDRVPMKGTLHKVITDAYFREIPNDKADIPAALARARATSWGLVYFLMQDTEREKFRAYLKELARLPRDMELSDEILERCFYRAFDLWDESRQQVKERELQDLEARWFGVLKTIPTEYDELFASVKKAREIMIKASLPPSSATPGQPMGPGRPGGPPGGLGGGPARP